jgi:choline dehydrogenase-like flavoprotein
MEAGRNVTMDDFRNMASPLDSWHRGAGEAATLYTTNTGTQFLAPNVVYPPNLTDEPYTVAPGSQFRWSRSRLRRRPHESLRARDAALFGLRLQEQVDAGVGFDWPIAYEDLAPYYDKTERFIGVTGGPKDCARRRTASSRRRAVQAARGADRQVVREARHQGDELAPGR